MKKLSTDDLELGMMVCPAHMDPEEWGYRQLWHKELIRENDSGWKKWELGTGNQLNGWWTTEYWWVAPEEDTDG